MSELSGLLLLPEAAGDVDIRAVTADSRRAAEGRFSWPSRAPSPMAAATLRMRFRAALRPCWRHPAPTWPPGVPARPLIEDARPRLRLAQIAARLAGPPPKMLVGVTGTNGKTSTVDFLRQLWTLSGMRAASLGTLGVIAPGVLAGGGSAMTTPDPVALSETLAELAHAGVGRAALEASSHGLDQFRLDGLRFCAAAFTNLTRDHLDYHGDFSCYRTAKLRLFAELLDTGGVAVASTALDAATMHALAEILRAQKIELRTVGENGSALRLLRATARPDGQVLDVEADGRRHEVALHLPGRFQADNVLVAAALARATGVSDVFPLLPQLSGVRGRMELAARLDNGAAVYVDYAHTPDALERLLSALRPHTSGRLIVVFGAGGDRDPGKRPLMGAACARFADVCIVTDDNPRSEDPAKIRAAVLAGCPDGRDGGTRENAIAMGLDMLRERDVLAVAGKGHEQGQSIAGTILPFDDVATVRRLAGVAP